MIRRILPRALGVVALTSAVLLMSGPPVPADSSGNELRFEAGNAVYEAQGSFKTWKFTEVSIPGHDLTKGRVAFEVDLASVSEKTADLADHLRTVDFFDVEIFPIATVVIHDIAEGENGQYKAIASVTIRKKTVDVPATFEVLSQDPLQVRGEAVLDRVAFGIGEPYDSAEEYSIRQEVKILLKATLPHQH